jgi:predicted GNAT family N-acyltransferase
MAAKEKTDTGNYVVRPIEWESLEGEEARRIRFEVFVREQKVPPESELDDIDPIALHVLSSDAGETPCGTGRLFQDPDDASCAHIGRMAVVHDARGTGCGAAMVRALLDEARRLGYRRVELSSQEHAVAFYRKFGFEPRGEQYMDCGIPHCDMELDLP